MARCAEPSGILQTARAMVLRYGMSEALGNVAYDHERSAFLQPDMPLPQHRDYSEDTAKAIDGAVRTLIDQSYARAIVILQSNRALLDRTAEELLKTETLNQPQIEALKREIIAGPIPLLPGTA